MADNLLLRLLKRIGKAIIDVSLKALIVYIAVTMFGAGGVIWIALRGDPHGPWFYAIAGALASCMVTLLILAVLVAVRLSRKNDEPLDLPSKEDLAHMEWVYGRAKEQAQQIGRVVTVTDLRVLPTGISRPSDPYIEFTVTLWNHSMFDVEIEELTGVLGLNQWEFRKPVAWVSNNKKPRTVWANNPASYTFRQDLAPDDVVQIRELRAHFTMALELSVRGFEKSGALLKSQPIRWGGHIPTNQSLVETLGGTWVRETA